MFLPLNHCINLSSWLLFKFILTFIQNINFPSLKIKFSCFFFPDHFLTCATHSVDIKAYLKDSVAYLLAYMAWTVFLLLPDNRIYVCDIKMFMYTTSCRSDLHTVMYMTCIRSLPSMSRQMVIFQNIFP